LPYVYEFLLNQEIVSGVLYRDILDKVALMKAKLVAAYSHLRGKLLLLRNWIRNFPTALYVFRIHKAGRSPDAEERVVICGKINLKR
jgi:hypothetical protein